MVEWFRNLEVPNEAKEVAVEVLLELELPNLEEERIQVKHKNLEIICLEVNSYLLWNIYLPS